MSPASPLGCLQTPLAPRGQALRVHIGTHGKPAAGATREGVMGQAGLDALNENERALAARFVSRGWRARWLYGVARPGCIDPSSFRLSPWGPLCMADGALSFVNERLLARHGRRV